MLGAREQTFWLTLVGVAEQPWAIIGKFSEHGLTNVLLLSL